MFNEAHGLFRKTARRFIEAQIAPQHAQSESEGCVRHDLWLQAGATGLLGCPIPQACGGAGADELFKFALIKELARSGFSGPQFSGA